MVKRIFKRIFVFAVIACLLFACVPSVAFADVVEFQEAAKLGATIVDLYGSVNNTSLAYDALSDGSALTVIENLYQNYSTSASDPYTLAAIGAAAAAAGAIAVVYDAITGKGYVQLYQTEYIESLDGFWDYTLGDLGLSRNLDGLFEWTFNQSGVVDPVLVVSLSGSGVLPLISNPVANAATYNSAFHAFLSSAPYDDAYFASSSNVYCFLIANGNNSVLTFASFNNSNIAHSIYPISGGNYRIGDVSYNSNVSVDGYTCYYRRALSESSSYYVSSLTTFLSIEDAVSTILGGDSKFRVNCVTASPEYYVGDPLTAQPTITIPDPASPQYVPSPSRIDTDIEWLPEWGDPLPDGVSEPVPGIPYPVTDPAILNEAVPDIWQSVVQGVQTDPGTDPDPDPDPDPSPSPSEVFTPLLPVTLPSFNFSFSGIWHYVREWVASLGAWFTTLFTIWSSLPYAMVVPVYATAVVVIVLGVYKRFFM